MPMRGYDEDCVGWTEDTARAIRGYVETNISSTIGMGDYLHVCLIRTPLAR